MKKLNRREKVILRLTLLVVLAAALMQGSEAYFKAKQELIAENEQLQETIKTFETRLQEESKDTYDEQTAVIETDLTESRKKVLGLPDENGANSFIGQLISDNAEAAGVVVNSITNRKVAAIENGFGMTEIHTFFVFESDLPALLNFFEMLSGQNLYIRIENLNINSRASRLRGLKSRRLDKIERKALSGNATLTVLFKANPEGKREQFQVRVEPKKLEIVNIVEAPPIKQDVTPDEPKSDPRANRGRPQRPSRVRPTRSLDNGGEPAKTNPSRPVRIAPATKQENPEPVAQDDYQEESEQSRGLVEEPAPEPQTDENGAIAPEIVVAKPEGEDNGRDQAPPPQNQPKPRLNNRPRALSHTIAPLRPAQGGIK